MLFAIIYMNPVQYTLVNTLKMCYEIGMKNEATLLNNTDTKKLKVKLCLHIQRQTETYLNNGT